MKKLTDSQSFFLNAVRFVAAAMVVMYHGFCGFFNRVGVDRHTEPYYERLGFVGVSTFFILSGFVIAYTVARKASAPGGYSLKTYLIERVSRIYIVLIPALAAVVLVDIFLLKRVSPDLDFCVSPRTIFAALLMVNNVTVFGENVAFTPTIYGMEPAWSLAFEMCFYVLFGLIVLFSDPRRYRPAKIVALVATLVFLSRLPLAFLMSYNWLLGVLGVYLLPRDIMLKRSACIGLMGAVILATAGVLALAGGQAALQNNWISISLLAAVFYALFMASGTFAIGARLGAAAKFLASYSYSMYLLHYTLLNVAYDYLFDVQVIYAKGPAARVLFLTSLFLAINALSFLFSLATEKNTSRLRKLLLHAPEAPAVGT